MAELCRVVKHELHPCRIQNQGRSDALSCAEFGRLHQFLTDMQQSFKYFGQIPGQLQQSEALQALEHAGNNSLTHQNMCLAMNVSHVLPVMPKAKPHAC